MKRVLKWSAGILVVSVIALAGAGGLASQYQQYNNIKNGLNEMNGVTIGETREELLYSLGQPTWTQTKWNSSDVVLPDSTTDPNAAETVNTSNILTWYDKGFMLSVEIDPETQKVSRMQCSGSFTGESSVRCMTILQISSNGEPYYGSEDYIVQKLGVPDETVYDKVKDVNRKIIRYHSLGITFVLAGEQVWSITQWGMRQSFFSWMLHGPKSAY